MIKNGPASLFRTFSRILKLGQEGDVNRVSKSYFSMTSNDSKKRPYTVIVEGNIGSGKTTFLEPFTRDHPDAVEVLAEPVSI